MKPPYSILAPVFVAALAGPAAAQEAAPAAATESAQTAAPIEPAPPPAAHADAHAHHPYHAAIFGGAAIANHEAHPALGLELERRLGGGFLGVGALGEAAFGAHLAVVGAAGVVAHPFGGLKLLAFPGVESADGHAEFLVRAGAAYDLHLGRWSVTPGANLDFVAGHVNQVYGVAVGVGF